MRVIVGGAYNGKRKFVENYLHHAEFNKVHWFEGELPEGDFTKEEVVVVANFETLLWQFLQQEEDDIVEFIIKQLQKLNANTNVICICTDIGRGIVPLDKNERKIRDTCGRLYQNLFAVSKDVCRIWYGIPQALKGEEWYNE